MSLPPESKLYTYEEISQFSLEHLMESELDKLGNPIMTPLVRKFRKDLTELDYNYYVVNKFLYNCESVKKAIFEQRFDLLTGIPYVTCRSEWDMENEDCYFFFHKDSDIVQPEVEKLVKNNLEEKTKSEQEKFELESTRLSDLFLIDKQYMKEPIEKGSPWAKWNEPGLQLVYLFLQDYEKPILRYGEDLMANEYLIYIQLLHTYGKSNN